MLVLPLAILGFIGKCAAPLVGQLVGEMAGDIFFSALLVLCAIHYNQEL
jgi:hypothetical protein